MTDDFRSPPGLDTSDPLIGVPGPDPNPEMGSHRMMIGRVKRLAVVSSVALGVIFVLAVTQLEASPVINFMLAAGWVLMPTLLVASVRRPKLRYLLIAPSTLVSSALVLINLRALPDNDVSRAGWHLITGGILLGGLLGIWFWFRWLPVPRTLTEPFSPARWTLIGIHVAMILVGLALVIVAS